MIGPFVETDDSGQFRSLVIRQFNLERRVMMGWYLKFDAERKELEISERFGERIVGLKLLIKVRADGTLSYDESVKAGEAKDDVKPLLSLIFDPRR